METLTATDPRWIYKAPDDKSAKCLLLTNGGIAVIGCWQNVVGIMAHSPFPKRDKLKEEELGLR